MQPLFSILLPTHNRAETLQLALESVLAQTDQRFEVLVVGDGCTDRSAEVVQAFGDERLRWFDLPKAPNFGYRNRNVALAEARGDLIAFMAHDDLWFSDHLELVRAPFDDPSVDLAYSMPLWIDPDGRMTPTPFNLEDPEVLDSFVERRRNLLPAGNVVHRRSCFARVGFWDDTLKGCGDWDLWARIIVSGERRNFRYLPPPTCLHFRAVWRRDPVLEPPELLASYSTRRRFPRWDKVLTLDCSGHGLEQAGAWKALGDGGPEGLALLRRNVAQYLDRRNIELDLLCDPSRQERSAAERTSLASSLFDAGFEGRRFTHSMSFDGFIEDERGVRWLGRHAEVRVACGGEKPVVALDLICSEPALYDRFPFTVTYAVDGAVRGTMAFSARHRRHHRRFEIPRDCVLSFDSTGCWRAPPGCSAALVRLQVGEPLAWSAYRCARRLAARALKGS